MPTTTEQFSGAEYERPVPGTWSPGQHVGRYTLLAVIAQGGMGEVWLARLSGPQNFVKLFAIKRVVATLAAQPDHVAMLAEEARLCALLQHPNIIPIFEFGEDHGIAFFVMEYVSGESLGFVQRMMSTQSLALPLLYRVFIGREVASALAYAHDLSDATGKPLHLVHRDVSPSNILVTPDGTVKLFDFGIARSDSREHHTQSGLVKGKLRYMPPEQLNGEKLDGRADQFALGVVLAELFAGRRVHETTLVETGADDLVHMLVNAVPTDAPNELKSTVARMLSVKRDDRFPTMHECAAALTSCMEQLPKAGKTFQQCLREGLAEQFERRAKFVSGAFQRVRPSHPSLPPPSYPSLSAVPVPETPTKDLAAIPPAPAAFPEKPSSPAPPLRTRPPLIPGAIAAVLVLVTSAALIVGSARRNSTPMPPSRPEKPAPSSVELPAAVATSTASPPETVPSELPGTTTDKGAAGLAKPPKPSPRPGAEAVGRLSLQSDPWTFVYLGKKLLGETPLIDVPLKAGQYQLRLVNEESSISTVIEVNIQPSKQTTLNLKL